MGGIGIFAKLRILEARIRRSSVDAGCCIIGASVYSLGESFKRVKGFFTNTAGDASSTCC